MMEHAVHESRKIYKDTPFADIFHIFHDALTQWWEKDAQAFLATIFELDRQIKCVSICDRC